MHGFVAGIVMLDSEATRIPGDPGHAGTFGFPVCYATARGFGIDDMLEYRPERLGPVIVAVRELEQAGVRFGGGPDAEALRTGTVEAALRLVAGQRPIGAIVLECSNLATFRSDVQQAMGVPVFDMVSLIESFADGYRQRAFDFPYVVSGVGGNVVKTKATILSSRGREGGASRDPMYGRVVIVPTT